MMRSESLSPTVDQSAQTAVLITRPEPGASETAARLAAIGLSPIVAPVLAIVPTTLRLPHTASLAAVLVTSGNALPALLPVCRDRLILTVGDATARRAKAAGFSNVVSAGGDAAALTELVRQRLRTADGSLLLASGQGQGNALAAALRSDGYRVLRRVVYASRPVTALPEQAGLALAAGLVRAALFFSAETARHFVHLIRASGLRDSIQSSDAVAIGRTAGVALTTLPWRRVLVAAHPNQNEMLALLQ
jgi:uroporphyrinogen-III synthase